MNDPYAKRPRGRTCVYYQQGKCNRPNCNFSHDIQPGPPFAPPPQLPTSNGFTNGSLDSSQELGGPQPVPSVALHQQDDYPRFGSAYKTKPCRFYARGKCTAGDSCRWSHDDGPATPEGERAAADVPGGFKLVPKSYRTLPCARYQQGHCYYGDECNFIHATPQTSNPSTPPVSSPHPSGPSPPINPTPAPIAQKAHSTHHSPAISSLNAPAIRSSISGSMPASAPLSAPTRPRELPPPQSRVHYSGVDWGVGTPGTPSKGIGTPPIFASSPLITAAATEWPHPTVSRTNSLQPAVEVPTGNATSSQPQTRSPFLLTFGEIGPGGMNSATASPRGLGLNGDSLTGGLSSSLPTSSNHRLGSPAVFGSALGTTGMVMNRQKSRLSTTDVLDDDEEAGVDADAETEPDFPTIINYNELSDLVTEPDDMRSPGPDYELRQGVADALRNGPNGDFAQPRFGGGADGFGGYTNGGYNGYENDWGRALHMLNNTTQPQSFDRSNGSGYGDQYRGGYKSRPCKYFVVGSRCPSGQNCTFIHDPEAMRRPSIPQNTGPKPMGDQHPLFRTRECKYHLAGHCHQEEACDFKHTGPPGQGREYENWEGFSIKVKEHEGGSDDHTAYRSRPCKWFLKGNCFHGDNCTYLHEYPSSRPPPCHFFRNGNGHCIAGDNCRFSHEIMDPDSEHTYPSLDDPSPQQTQTASVTSSDSSRAIPKVVSTQYDPEDEIHTSHYDEPYFGGGVSGLNPGDSLTVQGPKIELVVSEGEEDDEEDDVVIMRPPITNSREDSTKQDVEKLFASLSVAGAA